MRIVLTLVILVSNLLGQTGQVTVPIVSNSPNSPYRQLSLLTQEIDKLREELNMLKNKQALLEAENKRLKNGSILQEMRKLQTNYIDLEQKVKSICRFSNDGGKEKYSFVQKELQVNKDFLAQVEKKILTILSDWCRQAERKIEANHASLEELKHNLPKSNDWTSSNAFLAFKNENEQHVRKLVDFLAEEKVAQFNKRLNEQDQKICQLAKDNGSQGNLNYSFQKMERKLGEFCKTTCDETIRQVNDRLQNLAQQMQSGFDALSCAKCVQHTIASGESLSSIAQRYRTTPAQIRAVNGLQNSKGLRVGDTILIPKNQ